MSIDMDYTEALKRDVNMRKKYIKINQGDYEMYLMSLTADELIEFSAVDYFKPEGKNRGYQRQLITNHYRKISKYLEEEILAGANPILPPAILAATDPDYLKVSDTFLEFNKVIRIVDGQHRIRGLKYLKENNPNAYSKINSFEFSVILMVIKDKQKIHEVNTFVNINSKGKKVSTDLAILLRDRIREEEFNEKASYLDEEEFVEAIATNISKNLDKDTSSPWLNSIKMAGGAFDKGKPISINAFNQSLKDMILLYIKLNSIEPTMPNILDVAEDLDSYLWEIWNVIMVRWPECFNIYKPIKHNNSFNVQKGIGVYPLHQLAYETLMINNAEFEKSLEAFKVILTKSKVNYVDWRIGGVLSSYNSRAGFKKITAFIKNEIDLYSSEES